MNILPKKSWHVRNKNNIARVRRDEAKAAEEEKETQRRIALAAQEARTSLLRERASRRLAESSEDVLSTSTVVCEKVPNESESNDVRFGIPLGSLKDVVQPDGHVNFFQDFEAGKREGGTNAEHEDEKRKEQEEYEKKIGYLVYLGQGSLEESRAQPWYTKLDRSKPLELEDEVKAVKELDSAAGRIGGLEEKSKAASAENLKMAKFKSFEDPLKDIRKILSTPGMKSKLDNLPSTSSRYSENCSSTVVADSSIKKRRADSPYSEKLSYKKRKTVTENKHKHSKHSKKSKKHKKSSSKHKKKRSHRSISSDASDSARSDSGDEDKRDKLAKLRQERLQREREEKKKAEKALAKIRGDVTSNSTPQPKESLSEQSFSRVKQKYNSQFNPHLARQNYD